jgi:broad specificity phosphatase PhoE
MHLTLICHGATEATRRAAFPEDEPLKEGSIHEAEAAGRLLAHADRAWTSPALCARQTAEALALEANIHAALRECDYGRWTGLALKNVAASEPDAVALWLSDLSAAPHGGETLADLCRRVSAWIDDTLAGRGHAVAVTHASAIRAAVVHVLEAPATAFWRIDIEPLSAVTVTGDGRVRKLRFPASRIQTL